MPTPPCKVVLVNAPPFEVVEPWYDRPAFGRHALAVLAGYLRAHDSFAIELIDAKLERLDFAETARRVEAAAPDVVGFTAFTNEIKPAAHLAELLRHRLPRARFLIGGVHFTALPERTLREFPAFDAGCVGEGEVTLLEACRAIRDGRPLDGVAGIVYRAGDALSRTADRPKLEDLDELPLPAWDLLPRADEYWVMTQRGCPFTCRFCVNPNGRHPRQHSLDRALAEIDDVVRRFAPRKLWFADEIFSIDIERTRQLLARMIDAGVGRRTKWWAETHVKFVDEALFVQMRAAGCEECALGIEAGDETALKQLGKGTNIRMIEEAFAAARRAGLRSIGFFILGHPDETLASIRRTIALAVRINPSMPIFGVMVPYPGTEVARLAALGEGGYRLLTDDWNAFNKQIGGALSFAGLTRRQIELAQMRAYAEVFLRNGRYREFARFVWNYRTAGVKLLRKIVSGEMAADEAPPLTEARRAELAEAARAWARSQVENVRQLKSLGVRRGGVVPRPRAAG